MSLLQRSILAWLLALGMLGGNASAAALSPDSAHRQGGRRGRGPNLALQLEAQQRELEAVRTRERDLLGEMTRLESLIEAQQQNLGRRQARRDEARARLLQHNRDLEQLRARLQAAEARLQARLRALYKYARRGYLGFLMGASGLDQFRRRTTYVTAVLREDRNLLRRLNRKRKEYMLQVAALEKEMVSARRRLH